MMKKNLVVLMLLVIGCTSKKQGDDHINVREVDSLPINDSTFEGQIFDDQGKLIFGNLNSIDKSSTGDGVNGTIIRQLIKDDTVGSSGKYILYKEEYATEHFLAYVKKDTINLGANFEFGMSLFVDDFELYLTENGEERKVLKEDVKWSENDANEFHYSVISDTRGLNNFEGRITIDSQQYYINYKYIVL